MKVAAECTAPTLQAPFVCQLCGDGFVTMRALWNHARAQHHSWAEYRKWLIFELQQCETVPLQPIEKRRLAGSFYQDLLYSRPARDTLRQDHVTMKQIVACATCAVKDWIDDFYPCYAWKEAPSDAAASTAETNGTTEPSMTTTWTKNMSPKGAPPGRRCEMRKVSTISVRST